MSRDNVQFTSEYRYYSEIVGFDIENGRLFVIKHKKHMFVNNLILLQFASVVPEMLSYLNQSCVYYIIYDRVGWELF